MSSKWIAVAGALLATLGVALGAFGAHGLESQLEKLGRAENLSQRLGWYDTAVRYHMYHALGCLAVAALAARNRRGGIKRAPRLILGIALFSGSLYAMTFLDDAWRKLGAVTPLGGLAMIAGWVCLAVASWRS